MKILIYGAGVLGSHLAQVLLRCRHDVTLLARGKRLAELREHGLVIRHYVQKTTTRDDIKLTDSYHKDDVYDIVFVVMRRNQLDDVLPQLCANAHSPLIVLVGNNPAADKTQQYIEANSNVPKRVVYGFQVAGGRRENGMVISVHFGFSKRAGSMTLGSLDGDDTYKELLRQAFRASKFRLQFHNNMDVWLKAHVAFIMPLCFACYSVNGQLKRIARNKAMLNLMIDAMDDAYRILETCGYTVDQQDLDFVRRHRFKCYLMLKIMAATPFGRLAVSDHAMSAKDEMRRLYDDFCVFKQKARIAVPAWNQLEKYMAEAEH